MLVEQNCMNNKARPLLVLCHHAEEKAGPLMVSLLAGLSAGQRFSQTGNDQLCYINVREKGSFRLACAWAGRHPDGIILYNGINVLRRMTTLKMLFMTCLKYKTRQVVFWHDGATVLRLFTGLEGRNFGSRLWSAFRYRVVRYLLTNSRTYHMTVSMQIKHLALYVFGIEPERCVVCGETLLVGAYSGKKRTISEGSIKLCMAGVPTHRKGVDIFIEMAGRFSSWGNQKLKYTWFGGSEASLKRLEKSTLGVATGESGILFTGWVNPLQSKLKDEDIFLLTSREDPCPIVALEALACDLPVFCFEATGTAEFVPPAFVCRDQDDMVRKVKEFLNSYESYPEGYFRDIAVTRGHDAFFRDGWQQLMKLMEKA
ncbi:MAG: glycosyltransferase [Bacteroidia bacterium]|nr:glycosyltransferase [Bacteroidia bacterium]